MLPRRAYLQLRNPWEQGVRALNFYKASWERKQSMLSRAEQSKAAGPTKIAVRRSLHVSQAHWPLLLVLNISAGENRQQAGP